MVHDTQKLLVGNLADKLVEAGIQQGKWIKYISFTACWLVVLKFCLLVGNTRFSLNDDSRLMKFRRKKEEFFIANFLQ